MQRERVEEIQDTPECAFPWLQPVQFRYLTYWHLSTAAASDDERALRVSHICTATISMRCSVRSPESGALDFLEHLLLICRHPKHSSFDNFDVVPISDVTSRPQLADQAIYKCSFGQKALNITHREPILMVSSSAV